MSAPDNWLFLSAGREVSEDQAAAISALESSGDEERATIYASAFLALRIEAEGLLRCGMTTRPEDLLKLSRIERSALEAAATRLAIDHAATIGEASQSAERAAFVRAPLDGGEAHDDLVFDEGFARVCAGMRAVLGGDSGQR